MNEFFGIAILFFFFFGFISHCVAPDEKYKKNMDTFEKAVGSGLKKYFVFEGTATRSEFWYFALFTFIGSWIITLADWLLGVTEYIMDDDIEFLDVWVLSIIFSIAVAIPSWAVGARRLHAVGKSGWWQLISITVIGLIPLIIWWATKESKPYKVSAGRSYKSKSELSEELKELKQLYEDGTLSKEEFTKAKNKLLQ